MAEASLASAMLLRRPVARVAGSLAVASRAATLPQPELLPMRERVSARRDPDRFTALRVLIVEDDPPVRHACAEIAAGLGYSVETADSVPSARTLLKRTAVDILLLDLKLPGGGGFSLLEEVRTAYPHMLAVVMTAFATVTSAVEAMRTGAGDYLPKPFTMEELTAVLERAAKRRNALDEGRALRERMHSGKTVGLLMGQDPAMEKLFRILGKVAHTHHPVLILGENGTGKELVARAIHANGPLAGRPFVPVDCGSLLPTLIERELFGYTEAGSKTTARSKTGLLALAEGGTVFLDEIGDLPLDLQAKLLRALQHREVQPMSGGTVVPMQARVLASTNRDLAGMVVTGRFRKDLFYRLNVVNMRIPPLRERPGDIPLLAAHLLDRFSREQQMPYTYSDDALRLMMEYDWPGNVRELEHAIERACTFSSGPVVHLADLPSPLQENRFHQRAEADTMPFPINAAGGVVPITELERQAIVKTLRQLNGDKLLAAKLLGIGKTTLYRKLKEYGLSEEFE